MTKLRRLAWLAEVLEVPEGTVRSMASRSEIPVVRLGPRVTRVDEVEILAWVDAHRVAKGDRDELTDARGELRKRAAERRARR
jgi:hypothetical protein